VAGRPGKPGCQGDDGRHGRGCLEPPHDHAAASPLKPRPTRRGSNKGINFLGNVNPAAEGRPQIVHKRRRQLGFCVVSGWIIRTRHHIFSPGEVRKGVAGFTFFQIVRIVFRPGRAKVDSRAA
jgi:hypothetical protein